MNGIHSFFVDGRLVYVPDDDMDEFLEQNGSAEEADVFAATNADGETREFTVPRSRAEDFAARAAQGGGSVTRMRRVEMDDGETLTLGDGAIQQLVQARKQGEVMSRGLMKMAGIPDAYARGRAEREALADALGRMFPGEGAVDGLGAPQDNLGDRIVRGGNVIRETAGRAAEAVRTSPAVAGAVGAAKGFYEGAMGNPTEAIEDFYGEDSLPAEMLKNANSVANAFAKAGAQTASAALGGRDTAAGRVVRGFGDGLRTDFADLETGSETGNAVLGFADKFVKETLPTLAKYAAPGVAAVDIMGGIADTYYDAYERALANGAPPEKAAALAAAQSGVGAAEGLWLAKSAAGGATRSAFKAAVGRVLGMGGKMGVSAGARDVVEQGVEGAESPDLLRTGKAAGAGALHGSLFELTGMGMRALADAPRRAAEAASAKRVREGVEKVAREADARARYESRLSDEAEADINATVAKMVESGVVPSWKNTPEVARRAREKIGGRGRGEDHAAVEQAVMEAAQEVAEGLQTPARVSSAALERRQVEAASRRNEYWARRSEELAREYGAEEAARRVEAERRAAEGEAATRAADAEAHAARQGDLDAAFDAKGAHREASMRGMEERARIRREEAEYERQEAERKAREAAEEAAAPEVGAERAALEAEQAAARKAVEDAANAVPDMRLSSEYAEWLRKKGRADTDKNFNKFVMENDLDPALRVERGREANPDLAGGDSARAEAPAARTSEPPPEPEPARKPAAPSADAEAARRAEIDAMRKDPVLQRIDGQYQRAGTDAERAALRDAFAVRVEELRRGAAKRNPTETAPEAQTPPVSKTETTAAKTEIPVRGTETNVHGGETPSRTSDQAAPVPKSLDPKAGGSTSASAKATVVYAAGRKNLMASRHTSVEHEGNEKSESVIYSPSDGTRPFRVNRATFNHGNRGSTKRDNLRVWEHLGETLDASVELPEHGRATDFRMAKVVIDGEEAHVLITIPRDGGAAKVDVMRGLNTKRAAKAIGNARAYQGGEVARSFAVTEDSIANLDRAWQEGFKPGILAHDKAVGRIDSYTRREPPTAKPSAPGAETPVAEVPVAKPNPSRVAVPKPQPQGGAPLKDAVERLRKVRADKSAAPEAVAAMRTLGVDGGLPDAQLKAKMREWGRHADDPRVAARLKAAEVIMADRAAKGKADPHATETLKALAPDGAAADGGDVNGGEGRLDMARLDPKRRSDPKVLAWARKQGRTVADGKVTPDAVREYDAQQAKAAAKAAKNWFPDMKTVYHDYGEGVERGQHAIDLRDTTGKALGWFDPASKEVHLFPGADAKTVAHEIMWHGTRDWAKRAAAQGDRRAASLLAKMREVEAGAPEEVKRIVRWLYRKNGVVDADTLSNEYGAWATMGRGGAALERAMEKAENRTWLAREFAAAKGLVREFLAKNGGNRADLSRIDSMGRDEFVEYVAERFAGGKTLGEIGAAKGTGRAVSTKETLWQRYRRKVYDVNSSIRDLQRSIEKKTGRKLTEDEDVEMANALTPGLREAAVMSVRSKLRQYRELLHGHGLSDADVQYYMALKAAAGRDAKVDARNLAEIRAEVERGLRREWGAERVRTEKEAFAAELARRQAEAVADYRSTNGSHVDPREARAMLAEIEGGEKAADYAAARKFLRGLMDETLSAQERSGLVSSEAAARFRAEEPDYVPFKNEFDADTGEFVGRGSREFLRPEHYAAKGRKTAAGDVTAHIFGDYQATLLRGIETDVRQKLAALVRANPELGRVERVGEGERPKEKRSSDAKDPKNLTGDPNLVLFKEGGDTYAIRLEGTRGSSVAAAITERNVKRLDGAFAKFARSQAGMATRWSITFPQRNFTKDNIELANIVYSEKGLVKGSKWMKAYTAGQAKNAAALVKYVTTGKIDEATEGGRTVKAFIDAGGLISGGATEGYAAIKQSLTPEAIAREIARGKSVARAAAKHTLHSLAYINEFAELTTRVNAFAAERSQGASDRAAALFARRATVDFNRHGENTGVTNVWRLFSNSTLGATARATAALGTSKYGRRVAGTLFTLGFAQAIAEEWMNGDEDRKREKEGLATGKDVSEYDRKTSLIHLRVGDKYYKLAQHESPFSLCVYSGDLVARALMGKVGWGEAAKHLGVSEAELLYHFTGLGSINLGSRSGTVGDDIKAAVVSGLVPSALQPFAEVATGIDYKGDPLYRKNFSGETPNAEVSKKSTPEWAVWAARLLNRISGGSAARKGYVDVHPEAVQKVAEGLGKNAAKDVLQAYEVGMAIRNREWGALDDRNKPFKRDYVKPLDGNTSRFYEAYGEYRKDKAEFEGLRAEWTAEERRDYLDKHPWLRLSPSGKRRVDSLVEAKNRTTPRSGLAAMGINQLRKLADGLVLQRDGRYAEPGIPVPDEVKERAKREILKKQALVLEAMGRQ